MGNEGEDAVRTVENIGDKTAAEVNGRTRVPDGQTADAVNEVKSVAKQGLTSQIKDYVALAQREDKTFQLWLRDDTVISGPLQKAIDKGEIVVRRIPRIIK